MKKFNIVLTSLRTTQSNWEHVLYVALKNLDGFPINGWVNGLMDKTLKTENILTAEKICSCGKITENFVFENNKISYDTTCTCGESVEYFQNELESISMGMEEICTVDLTKSSTYRPSKMSGAFTSKDGRSIAQDMLVGVHWNSHKDCYSIVAMESRNTVGLVLGYAQSVVLDDVTFKIDKAKQRNVVEKETKDRHAFVVGKLKNLESLVFDNGVYYNPFKVDTFVFEQAFNEKERVQQLTWVESVAMTTDGYAPKVTFDSVPFEVLLC